MSDIANAVMTTGAVTELDRLTNELAIQVLANLSFTFLTAALMQIGQANVD
jgi:hypothetical protein